MYADLHCHSIYSDGNAELEELMQVASENGVSHLALTDHDTIFHLDKAKEIGAAYGVEVIRGVEMSCYDFDVERKVHLIVLNQNQDCPHIEKLCDRVLKHRDRYHKKLIKEFCAMGYDITYEEAKQFSPYNIVFKMSIFKAILKKYSDSIDPYTFYLQHFAGPVDKEVDHEMGYIDIKEGIQAALKDGGTPIIAHPNSYDSYHQIDKYVSYGLKGIEISHPSMREEDIAKAKELARKHNLIISGGSDYHGCKNHQNKPTIGDFGLNEDQFKKLCESIEWRRKEPSVV